MKVSGDKVTFSSGRSRYANNGVIGLSPDLEVSEGYDGGFWGPDYWEEGPSALTKEDLRELADYMIEQWQKFRDRASQTQPGEHDG